MASLRTYALCVLSSLALMAPVNGSTATPAPGAGADHAGEITVPDTLTRGEQITVGYSNPSKAGQTVTIDVDDGTLGGKTDSIQIHLGDDGKGAATFTVPDWEFVVTFNGPDAGEKNRWL